MSRVIVGVSRRSKMLIPQNLLVSSGDEVEQFLDVDEWTPGGTTTIENNAVEFRSGIQSIKLTTPVDDYGSMSKDYSTPIETNMQRMRVSFYAPDDLVKYRRIQIRIITDIVNSRYFYHAFDFIKPARAMQKGWNTLDIYPSDWDGQNDPDWSDPISSIRFLVWPTTGNQVSVSFDLIQAGLETMPVALIRFDDGSISDYELAEPYLSSRRAIATSYIVSDWINSGANYMTDANLVELNSKGWGIANHSETHANLPTKTQAEVEAEVGNCKTYLDALGITRASDHVAYPYGEVDEMVQTAMAATNMITGQTSTDVNLPSSPIQDNNYSFGTRFMTDLVGAKLRVDTAVSDKRILSLGFHRIVLSGATGDQWNYDDFVELISYIVSKKLPFITIDQFWALKDSPILAKAPA